jgi:transcriptional regulator GlxA family with amidase domain
MSEDYVKKAIIYIEDNYPYDISVSDIAFHVGVDRTYLYRLFTKLRACSPSKYLINYRLDKAVEMLEDRDLSMLKISMSVGFHDISHFYKAFTARFGKPPKQIRREKYGE